MREKTRLKKTKNIIKEEGGNDKRGATFVSQYQEVEGAEEVFEVIMNDSLLLRYIKLQIQEPRRTPSLLCPIQISENQRQKP